MVIVRRPESLAVAELDKEKTRMTPQQYLEFLKAEHLAEEQITAQRNGDYSGKDNDAFSNFRRYGEIQFLSRMWEKFNRIENILLSGKTHCKDESVKDTLRDLSNYCHLLSGFLEDKK
jgi:hypothetical protein